MTTTSSLGPGGEFGDYTIDSMLGRGGMAVVFLAEDRRLGRQVAIKVLAEELAEDDSFRTRFVRESQLAASLDHPNIIPVYEAGELEDHLFIAMRYVRGTDLKTVITRDGPLDANRTVALVRPIASALDASHRRGLVHRDVKPANILVAVDEGDEHPYLSDFGLTKHTSSKSGLTKTGTFMGTVDYVAPEQIKGEEVDGRTDEYSLACLVYQCLTGHVPFDKEQDVATMFGHLQDPIPRVTDLRPDLPPEIDDVVARGMAKDRDDRFPTCTAMMQALAHAAGLETGPRDQPSFDPTVVAMAAQPGTGPMLPAAPDTPSSVSARTAAATAPTPPTPTETEMAPLVPADGRPGPDRRSLVIGGIVAGIAALVVAVVVLSGGGDEPRPNPAPTGGDSGTPSGPTGVLTFANDAPIDIPDAGVASPYPSTIGVGGVAGVIDGVTVTLEGFAHGFPRDVDLVLVGPQGQTVVLMEGTGGPGDVSGVTITFDDDAPLMTLDDPLASGTFAPTSEAGDGFGFNGPPPIPDPPYGATLSAFDDTDPNGTWSLFLFDDSEGSSGVIAGGWSLNIELSPEGGTGATGVTAGGEALFADDFADADPVWAGWDPFGRESIEQVDGTLSITLKTSGEKFTTTDAVTPVTADLQPLADVRVETLASMVSSTPSSAYGVVCRSTRPNEYYWFLIYPNGDYDVGKRTDDGQTVVTLAEGSSPAIEAGPNPNLVAGECQDGPDGSTVVLRLFVNGVAVASAVDTDHVLGPGLSGVIAEEYGADTEVAFDEFSVSTL